MTEVVKIIKTDFPIDERGAGCNPMKDKIKAFQEFYIKLYAGGNVPIEKIEVLIAKNIGDKFQNMDRELMEKPITEEELEKNDRLKIGKTLGIDDCVQNIIKV